jgi:hypothetical protein
MGQKNGSDTFLLEPDFRDTLRQFPSQDVFAISGLIKRIMDRMVLIASIDGILLVPRPIIANTATLNFQDKDTFLRMEYSDSRMATHHQSSPSAATQACPAGHRVRPAWAVGLVIRVDRQTRHIHPPPCLPASALRR